MTRPPHRNRPRGAVLEKAVGEPPRGSSHVQNGEPGDIKAEVIDEIEQVFKAKKAKMPYMVGTMIEVPRAALTADEVATEAEFFSFGTNDLTQMTYGFSRDDCDAYAVESQKRAAAAWAAGRLRIDDLRHDLALVSRDPSPAFLLIDGEVTERDKDRV